jgi:hypothetical protein
VNGSTELHKAVCALRAINLSHIWVNIPFDLGIPGSLKVLRLLCKLLQHSQPQQFGNFVEMAQTSVSWQSFTQSTSAFWHSA